MNMYVTSSSQHLLISTDAILCQHIQAKAVDTKDFVSMETAVRCSNLINIVNVDYTTNCLSHWNSLNLLPWRPSDEHWGPRS